MSLHYGTRGRCTAKGVPIYALGATASISLLAYMSASASSSNVLGWLLDLVNTGGFLSWVCYSITYLCFRRACSVQNVPKSDLTQRSFMQPYASYITLFVFSLMCLLNGFTVFFPSKWSVADFLPAYIGLPVFIGAYLVHRFLRWDHPWVVPAHLVDLRVSQEELDDASALEREAEGGRTCLQRLGYILHNNS